VKSKSLNLGRKHPPCPPLFPRMYSGNSTRSHWHGDGADSDIFGPRQSLIDGRVSFKLQLELFGDSDETRVFFFFRRPGGSQYFFAAASPVWLRRGVPFQGLSHGWLCDSDCKTYPSQYYVLGECAAPPIRLGTFNIFEVSSWE
jgi:hypothetical protein